MDNFTNCYRNTVRIFIVNLDCCFLVWKCSKISWIALFLSWCIRICIYKRILFTQLHRYQKNLPFKSWSASMFQAKIARRSKHNIKIYQRIPNLSWRHVNIDWTVKCRCCLITPFFIIEEYLSRSLVCDFVSVSSMIFTSQRKENIFCLR